MQRITVYSLWITMLVSGFLLNLAYAQNYTGFRQYQKTHASQHYKFKQKVIQKRLARAQRNLERLDLRIQDKEDDINLYKELEPSSTGLGTDLYSHSIESAKNELIILKKKRAELAQAIQEVSAYYRLPLSGNNTSRKHASENL